MSVKALASLIRMSHKYSIPDVLADALARMKRFYTSDLEEWSAISSREEYVKADPEDAITAIQLARLTDTPTLLPTAFLSCFALDATTVPSPSAGNTRTHILCQLPPEDLTRIIRGRVALMTLHVVRILPMRGTPGVPSAGCRSRTSCSKEMAAAFQVALDDFISSTLGTGQNDILLLPLADHLTAGSGVCDKCRPLVVDRLEEVRRFVWEALPEIFDLVVHDWP